MRKAFATLGAIAVAVSAYVATTGTEPPPPGEPPNGFYRQYAEAHVRDILDKIEADPTLLDPGPGWHGVGFAVLTHDISTVGPTTAEAIKQIKRARTLGIEAHPALRAHPSAADPFNPAHWEGVAAVITELSTKTRDPTDYSNRLGLDLEDYGPSLIYDDAFLAANNVTKRQLAQLMAPMLDTLSDKTCEIYPWNTKDHTHNLVAMSCGLVEDWAETSFAAAESIRVDSAAYRNAMHNTFLHTQETAQIVPTRSVRTGLRDDCLKSWGRSCREQIVEGAGQVWYFDYYRGNRTHDRAWFTGENFDARNDLARLWGPEGSQGPKDFVGSYWCADEVNAGENIHGAIRGTCTASGQMLTVGTDGNTMITCQTTGDCDYFWPNANGTGDEWLDGLTGYTVATTITIPSNVLGQFGILGHQTHWSLYVDSSTLFLRWVDAAGANIWAYAGTIQKDVPYQYAVAVDEAGETVAVAACSSPADCIGGVLLTSGPMAEGSPGHIYAGRAYTNIAAQGPKWVYCDGCTVDRVPMMLWERALPCADLAATDPALAWPWGRF